MSNVEDWERRNALPMGCAVGAILLCAITGGLLLYFALSGLLYPYEDYSRRDVVLCLLAGGLELAAAAWMGWRVYKGKPIPHVGAGDEGPPTVEEYHFLPKGDEDKK